jgi:hypothetical protein
MALAGCLACGTALLWAATKGPDAGGYTASDDAVYSFVDISGASGGATLLAGTDDGTALLTLPFSVRFYGQTYPQACVSTNGALYFVAAGDACDGFEADFANVDLSVAPVPQDRPALLPFWSDLSFQVPGAGGVLYQTLGTAPARRFVVQWQNAYPQGSPNPVRFQVVLSEASRDVLFQYAAVELGAGNPAHAGAQATVGIRNAGGTTTGQQLQWSYKVPVIGNQTVLRFAAGDSTPPLVTTSAQPARLWPPNGSTVPVTMSGTVTDAGGGVTATYSVTDEYGTGSQSGPVTVAADGSYSVTIGLIASRHGDDKDGRTYTIVITATDGAGNQGTAQTAVLVPHDARK